MELIKNASGDIWKFFKTYVGIHKDDDEKWIECLDVAEKLVEQYIGTDAEKYARKYMVVILSEIERMSKK